MISAKIATPAILKVRYFEIKEITSYILSITSTKNFCYMTQVALWMWSRDQSLVTLAFV